MNNKEAKDRLISLKLSYKIRIEEEDIEALEMGIKALENQKTGYWINVGYGYYECSECGRIEMCNPNYCQDCGAKMKGE